MARAGEIVLSNGDTEDWVKVEFETFSLQGKQMKAFLDTLIQPSDRLWDFKRKCWFISAGSIGPLLVGIRTLISGCNLNFSIVDKRVVHESFEDFFNEIPAGPAKEDKKALLRKLEFIFKEQANILVSVREDSEISSLKPYYRKAALALHPDRNSGDGSKMSELNRVWGLLNQ